MPSLLAAAAVLLFATYLSLFPLAAVLAARAWTAWSGPRGPDRGAPDRGVPAALSLAACWGGSELLRGWLFTGFPWLGIGYAHVDGPLAGFAPWLGVHGVGTVAALVAASLAFGVQAFSRKSHAEARKAIAIAVILPVAGALLAGHEPTTPSGAPVRVRLAQGNVPQQLKFDRQRALDAMLDYTRIVEASDAQLVVLPETAWTVPWGATPEEIAARITSHSRRQGVAIAIGMPLTEAAPVPEKAARYTNSVALLVDGTPRARYDKRHLVPFGEFIPTGFGWFVQLMHIPLGEFARGSRDQAPFEIGGQRFAFNICYEDLFGEELIGAIREGGASVLVNVSNIAWFGDSRALPQHLAISRMRTLETGRPMLRATNTGVTAFIDHRGRVQARLPHYRRDALDVSVQGTTGLTPYVRFGNLLPAALAAALLALARLAGGGGRRRNR
ncbi:MAG TPA: apolipoprotein N-acyltransferase, partial [Quisquiliibacterium sp.]|nr:apolipoprotein N-acyltransferase [Quisquiliibacterium sp.]